MPPRCWSGWPPAPRLAVFAATASKDSLCIDARPWRASDRGATFRHSGAFADAASGRCTISLGNQPITQHLRIAQSPCPAVHERDWPLPIWQQGARSSSDPMRRRTWSLVLLGPRLRRGLAHAGSPGGGAPARSSSSATPGSAADRRLPLSPPAVCVWGANTGVGKTLVSAGLARAAALAQVHDDGSNRSQTTARTQSAVAAAACETHARSCFAAARRPCARRCLLVCG